MAQMQWQSFTLPRELKRLWKRAAKQERISASEFLRRALSERLKKTLSNPIQDSGEAISLNKKVPVWQPPTPEQRGE